MDNLMRWLGEYLFLAVWVAYLVYWQAMAIGAKATLRLEPARSRILRTVLFLVAIFLLVYPRIPMSWLYWNLLPAGSATFLAGAAITVAGLLFSIWARHRLGRNWSRSVTIKQDHELIVSGPYALVRHPIYTGLLTGFLGSAIATAQVRGLVAFLLIFIALFVKLRLEEKWMRDQFGASYEAYSRRVATLIPYLL